MMMIVNFQCLLTPRCTRSAQALSWSSALQPILEDWGHPPKEGSPAPHESGTSRGTENPPDQSFSPRFATISSRKKKNKQIKNGKLPSCSREDKRRADESAR